jgi:hypothetical protein
MWWDSGCILPAVQVLHCTQLDTTPTLAGFFIPDSRSSESSLTLTAFWTTGSVCGPCFPGWKHRPHLGIYQSPSYLAFSCSHGAPGSWLLWAAELKFLTPWVSLNGLKVLLLFSEVTHVSMSLSLLCHGGKSWLLQNLHSAESVGCINAVP